MSIEIRPTFQIDSTLSREEIINRIVERLDNSGAACSGTVLADYIILRIPEAQSHFWSPRLTLEIREENGATHIKGLFAPRPVVWTMFASFYLFAIFLGFVGLMWGGAQWSLGMEPQALWLVGASVLSLTGAYGIALTGQKLSRDQMRVLRDFFYEAIGEALPDWQPAAREPS